MKRNLPVLFCIVFLFCSGCSEQESLPTEIYEVGDVLVKQDETLAPSQPLPEGISIPMSNENVSTVTSDMVCGWFSDVIEGAFSEMVAEDGFTIWTAGLEGGGVVEVMDYYGSYYSTTFVFPVTKDAETVISAAAGNIELYLSRRLADAEREELRQAVKSVLLGSEMMQLQTLSEYARVAVYLEDKEIRIQCS